MKFSEIKKELGKGRLLTIETSPYCEGSDDIPSVMVRSYDSDIDYSDSIRFEFNGFVQDSDDSVIVSAIKKALGVEKVFAYSDASSDINAVNDGAPIVWKNLLYSKNGNVAECCCTYLVSVKNGFNTDAIEDKVFNGIKFYCL